MHPTSIHHNGFEITPMSSAEPIKPRLENLLQHFQHRAGVYGPQPAIRERDLTAVFEKMLPALLEQTSHKFAFPPAGTNWIVELSRVVYAVLEQTREVQLSEKTEKLLMTVINALEAFIAAQALIANAVAAENNE